MLYVSLIKNGKLCVTDSDTGKHSWMSPQELIDAIDLNNTIINGAYLEDNGTLVMYMYPYAGTPQQAKTLLLQGYVVNVKSGSLKSLVFDKGFNKDVIVTLSSVCKVIDDFSIYVDDRNRYSITLVFDDNIKDVKSKAFANLYSGFVRLDLRYVTDEELLCKCYKAAVVGMPVKFYVNAIDDNFGRYSLYFTEALLLYSNRDVGMITSGEDFHILRRHKDEFLSYIPEDVDTKWLSTREEFWPNIKNTANRLNKVMQSDFTISDLQISLMLNLLSLCGAPKGINIVNKYLLAGGRDIEIYKKYINYVRMCVNCVVHK